MPVESGKPVDVMNTMNADSPSRPSGGTEEFTFTPTVQALSFLRQIMGERKPEAPIIISSMPIRADEVCQLI